MANDRSILTSSERERASVLSEGIVENARRIGDEARDGLARLERALSVADSYYTGV
jgi:hypothetical protein